MNDLNNINEINTIIPNLIHNIRGKQVMLDNDLSNLYLVKTKRLNEAVKRNIKRFPEEFMFQLTEDEYENLRSQIATSSKENNYGGRRYMPYVFTEQGIAMLSATLNSEVAIDVSIKIMNAFVEMRKFIVNNSIMFERISKLELNQLEYQKETDKQFNQVFDYMANQREVSQMIFFDGQIYDAFSLISNLISKAKSKIILVDNYVDIATLNLLSKKNDKTSAMIYTSNKSKLTPTDIATFNKQYPFLTIKYTNTFHDRFLINDDATAYHIGASIKDAGKKSFAITKIEDAVLIENLLAKLLQ
ncbi:MAG: ORF6N domain-containing protein [Peptostreptococcaceae bacterium]|nr:ORF6N domain-containing protein [Peptostreptococcaceae bacterium]